MEEESCVRGGCHALNPKGEHGEEGTDMSLAPLGYRARTKVSETPKKRCRDNRFTKNDSSQVWQHRLAIPDSKMQQDHKFKTSLDNFAKFCPKKVKRGLGNVALW